MTKYSYWVSGLTVALQYNTENTKLGLEKWIMSLLQDIFFLEASIKCPYSKGGAEEKAALILIMFSIQEITKNVRRLDNPYEQWGWERLRTP